jgi:Uma2 family endonuclease
MSRAASKLGLQEFLDLPESGDRFELVDGKLTPKMSPKYKHASVQGRLFRFLDNWCNQEQCGRVCPEWGVVLQRQGQDWVPIPDLTYVSYERLPEEWEEDEPCPVLPELVIEIISPGQSFGEMTQKATDYLLAGVSRVWVVDNQGKSVTAFGANEFPQTFWSDRIISDGLLPKLAIPVASLFTRRGE